MQHPANPIYIRDGARPAPFADGGWLDLDAAAGAVGPVIFPPEDPADAVAFLDTLARAAAWLRDAIAAPFNLTP